MGKPIIQKSRLSQLNFPHLSFLKPARGQHRKNGSPYCRLLITFVYVHTANKPVTEIKYTLFIQNHFVVIHLVHFRRSREGLIEIFQRCPHVHWGLKPRTFQLWVNTLPNTLSCPLIIYISTKHCHVQESLLARGYDWVLASSSLYKNQLSAHHRIVASKRRVSQGLHLPITGAHWRGNTDKEATLITGRWPADCCQWTCCFYWLWIVSIWHRYSLNAPQTPAWCLAKWQHGLAVPPIGGAASLRSLKT